MGLQSSLDLAAADLLGGMLDLEAQVSIMHLDVCNDQAGIAKTALRHSTIIARHQQPQRSSRIPTLHRLPHAFPGPWRLLRGCHLYAAVIASRKCSVVGRQVERLHAFSSSYRDFAALSCEPSISSSIEINQKCAKL